MTDTHLMNPIVYGKGADVYYCSVCGRIVAIQYSPYKKIVLAAGDEQVRHTGSRDGVELSSEVKEIEA